MKAPPFTYKCVILIGRFGNYVTPNTFFKILNSILVTSFTRFESKVHESCSQKELNNAEQKSLSSFFMASSAIVLFFLKLWGEFV